MINLTARQKEALLLPSIRERTVFKIYFGTSNRHNHLYDAGFLADESSSTSWGFLDSSILSSQGKFGYNAVKLDPDGVIFQNLSKKTEDFGYDFLKNRLDRVSSGSRYVLSYYRKASNSGTLTVSIASESMGTLHQFMVASSTSSSWTREEHDFTLTLDEGIASMPDDLYLNFLFEGDAGSSIYISCPMLEDDVQLADLTWLGTASPFVTLEPTYCYQKDDSVELTDYMVRFSLESNASFGHDSQLDMSSGSFTFFNDKGFFSPSNFQAPQEPLKWDEATGQWVSYSDNFGEVGFTSALMFGTLVGKQRADGLGAFRKGNRVVVYNEYIDTNRSLFRIPIGVFFVESATQNVISGEITVELSSYWSDLSKKNSSEIVSTSISSEDLISSLIFYAGYNVEQPSAEQFLEFNGSYSSYPFAVIPRDERYIDTIHKISVANAKSMYIDNNAKMVFRDLVNSSVVTAEESDYDNTIDISPEVVDAVSHVVVKADPYIISEATGERVDPTRSPGNVDQGLIDSGNPYAYELYADAIANPADITLGNNPDLDGLFDGVTISVVTDPFTLANGNGTQGRNEQDCPYIEIDIGQGANPVAGMHIWFDSRANENYLFKVAASLDNQRWWYLAGDKNTYEQSNPNGFENAKTAVAGFGMQYVRYLRIYMNGAIGLNYNRLFDIQIFKSSFVSTLVGSGGTGSGTVEVSDSGITIWKNQTHTDANVTFRAKARDGHVQIRGVGISNEANPILHIQGTASSGFKIYDGGVKAYNQAGDTKFHIDTNTGDVTIDGVINASSGLIAGWCVSPTCLCKNDAIISSTGYASFGTGTNIAIISAVDPDYRFWAGHTAGVSAPFSVDKFGAMRSTSGNIAGWCISSTDICKANLRVNSSGYISVGSTPPTSYGDNIGAWLGYSSSKAKLSLYATSSNYLKWDGDVLTVKAGNFALDSSGCITASNANLSGTICASAGCVGGFCLTTVNGLYSGTGATRVQMKSGSGFWAGHDTQTSAPFYVTAAGVLCSTSGTVGGWTLDTDKLCAGSASICSTGVAVFGTSNDVAIISAADSTYRFWAGHATAASAPFSVTKEGEIKATSGTIGGWTIGSNCISAAGFTLDCTGVAKANYEAGVSGWCLSADGSAEFQDITLRGNFPEGTIAGFTFNQTDGFYVGSGVTRFQMKPTVGLWMGATAVGDAPFRVCVNGCTYIAQLGVGMTASCTLDVLGASRICGALCVANGNITTACCICATGNILTAGMVCSSGAGHSYFAGNVGIGTTSPVSKLHIHGNYNNTGNGGFTLDATDTGDPERYVLRINPFVVGSSKVGYQFQTKSAIGGTNVPLTFDNAGNVGIANNTPTCFLDVCGNSRVCGCLCTSSNILAGGTLCSSSTGDNYLAGTLGIGVTPARPLHVRASNAYIRIDRDSNTSGLAMHVFPFGDYTTPYKGFLVGVDGYSANNGDFFIADYGQNVSGASTTRLLIDNAGNVGVGTETPNYKLDVNGTGFFCCHLIAPSVGSSNFASGLRGWCITGGTSELNNAVLRGELRSAVFKYDEISAVGGQLLVANAGTLLSCFTTPALGSSGTICLKETTSTPVQRFCVNDVVRVKTFNGTNIFDFWGVVTAYCNRTTYYDYTVTACSGSVGVVIPEGSTIVSYGPVTTGGGVLVNGQGSNSPFIDIFTNTATPWCELTPQVRLGRLDGITGFSGFGLWTNNGYIVGGVVQSTNYGPAAGSCFDLTNGCLILGGSSAPALAFDAATGNLCISGNISATTGSIAGWCVQATCMCKANSIISSSGFVSFGATPPTTYGANVGAWLGYSSGAKMSLYADASNYLQWDGAKLLVKAANFTLDSAGCITASNANISGTVCASAGCIGGWSIETNKICSTHMTIGQNFFGHGIGLSLYNGAGTTSVQVMADCIYDGSGYICHTGIIVRDTSGNPILRTTACASDSGGHCAFIAGWSFTHNCLYSGNLKLDSAGSIQGCYAATTGWCLGSDGTMKFGGSSAPKLSWDGSALTVCGTVCASVGCVGDWSITDKRLCKKNITLGQNPSNYGNGLTITDGGGTYAFQVMANCIYDGTSLICHSGVIVRNVAGTQVFRATSCATAASGECLFIGGTCFTSSCLYSGNYSAGSAGYALKSDGSADFQNVTVRGRVCATSGCFNGTLSAGIVNTTNLTVLATNLLNPVTQTGNVRGWGLNREDGTGSPSYISYDATECALEITNNGNVGVMSQSWMIDHNKIYRISMKIKKSSAHGSFYVGASQWATATLGTESNGNQQGTITFIPYSTTRVAGAPADNVYFASGSGSTSYECFIVYLIGANRSVNDAPIHCGGQIPFAHLNATAKHVSIRFLNWDNTTPTSMFVKDISAVDVGQGMIVSENITSGQIIGKDFRTQTDVGVANKVGVMFTSAGIDAYNGTARTFCLNASSGDLFLAGCMVSKGVFYRENTSTRFITGSATNTFIGDNAGNTTLTGSYNTGIGVDALCRITTGCYNLAIGMKAGCGITTGCNNHLIGYGSGYDLTTGSGNIGIGLYSLSWLTTGKDNIGIGGESTLKRAITASNNIAIGSYVSDFRDYTGSNSIIIGRASHRCATSGNLNIIVGSCSYNGVATGTDNVVIGHCSIQVATSAELNVGIGNGVFVALTTGVRNVTVGGLSSVNSGGYNASVGIASLGDLTTGCNNTAVGYYSMKSSTTGEGNTVVGAYSGLNITTGSRNTAIGTCSIGISGAASGLCNTAVGSSSLGCLTTGCYNTAIGNAAANQLTTGCSNTVVGYFAMCCLSTGCNNTAVGYGALCSVTTGSNLVAVGYDAMKGNTTGTDNVAYGDSALMCNTTGCYNVAIGQSALRLSRTTSFNLAIGPGALQSQVAGASVNVMIGAISGRDLTCAYSTVALGAATLSCAICSDHTVAIGAGALQYACGYINNSVFIGSAAGHSCCSGVSLKTQCSCYDIAIGFAAMCHPAGCRNVVIGADAVRFTCLTGVRNVIMGSCSGYQISSGSCNVIIGDYAGIGANATNGVAIGYNASVESNTIILGNGNHTVARMNPAGWSSLSDSRYKKNISYVCNALSIVKKLNPIYYTMCAELGDRLSIGMIAQEVKEVFDPSKFSIVDFSNGRYGIRYNDFISLNTSAIKELNSCLESQQCEIYYYQQCINSMKECISCFENRLSCIEKMLSGEC